MIRASGGGLHLRDREHRRQGDPTAGSGSTVVRSCAPDVAGGVVGQAPLVDERTVREHAQGDDHVVRIGLARPTRRRRRPPPPNDDEPFNSLLQYPVAGFAPPVDGRHRHLGQVGQPGQRGFGRATTWSGRRRSGTSPRRRPGTGTWSPNPRQGQPLRLVAIGVPVGRAGLHLPAGPLRSTAPGPRSPPPAVDAATEPPKPTPSAGRGRRTAGDGRRRDDGRSPRRGWPPRWSRYGGRSARPAAREQQHRRTAASECRRDPAGLHVRLAPLPRTAVGAAHHPRPVRQRSPPGCGTGDPR